MLIAKINLKFDTPAGGVFNMKAGVLYSNHEVPEWVVKLQNFKDATKKNLISGDRNEKKSLNTDLIKTANFLEINFTKDIEESALECLVADAEASRVSMLEALKEKDVAVAANSKPSTLRAKLEALEVK